MCATCLCGVDECVQLVCVGWMSVCNLFVWGGCVCATCLCGVDECVQLVCVGWMSVCNLFVWGG